jgi:FKBP-type peptidyl-prolyl cis-trans isomerase (trigger factor)
MLQKTVTNQPGSTVEVSITAPWSDISSKWDENLNKIAAEVELPGFRKGTAPLPMVESSQGQKIADEFLKAVMPQLLVEALQGSNVIPIDYPKYQLVSFSKGNDLVFKATLTQRPTVKIGDYKTINVTRPTIKVITDEDVEKVVQDLFKRWKAKNSAPGATLPEGASADEPNDQFAITLGAANMADLRTKIKQDLEAEAKYNNELDYEEAILQQVEKIADVDLPEVLIQDELNRMLVSLQKRVSEMGLLVDDYLKSQGETTEGIKTKWREQAEKNVRMELGLAEIGRLENINITDQELQAEIDKIQDARMKAQFEQQEPRLHLRHNLRQIRTLDLLKSLVNKPSA